MDITEHKLQCDAQPWEWAWFNRPGERHRTRVTDDGVIVWNGRTFRFIDSCLPAGTDVEVRIWADVYCVTVADIDSQAAADKQRQQQDDDARRDRLNKRRTNAQALNARIALPVTWEVAIKDVLSGLSANSNGDGRNRATVEHVRVLQELRDGRLIRKAGDFLCSRAQGNWANQQPEKAYDGDGNAYEPAVNCKACLRIAARWMRPDKGSTGDSEQPAG